jgi:hypothetical protein
MDAKQSLSKKSHQSISFLFKQYLSLVEDLRFEHSQYVERMKREIPEAYHPIINSAEYFSEARMQWLRKRILDFGNEVSRDYTEDLNDFSVSFVFKN